MEALKLMVGGFTLLGWPSSPSRVLPPHHKLRRSDERINADTCATCAASSPSAQHLDFRYTKASKGAEQIIPIFHTIRMLQSKVLLIAQMF